MEKSIESIWKEGFLGSNALVAPKLNDLYNQKSIDIVAKFRRMYKINIIGIIVFALVLLPIATLAHIPYMGMLFFVLFGVLVFFAIKFKRKLDTINSNENSYQYLKTFDKWTKDMIQFNTKLSRYLYPYVFLSMIVGFWCGSIGGDIPGEIFLEQFIEKFPDTILVFGLPLVGVVGVLIIVSLLAFFGGKIGEWDLKLGYGRILKRLEILLSDMEELRRNT